MWNCPFDAKYGSQSHEITYTDFPNFFFLNINLIFILIKIEESLRYLHKQYNAVNQTTLVNTNYNIIFYTNITLVTLPSKYTKRE